MALLVPIAFELTAATLMGIAATVGGVVAGAGVIGYYKGKGVRQGDDVLNEIIETEYNVILQLTDSNGKPIGNPTVLTRKFKGKLRAFYDLESKIKKEIQMIQN